ncbi:DUF4145 domain-containing protein [Tamlana sp. 2_MG-2023]|uniref:DUF4145 domain-containing protein n=1 Tax=unclassified Tamlana TaxID=2614803 RepID=UPI0026E3FC65|nr:MULTISPECIES: DUF4145 domain-containing protein [unclassified Tamlana]MDO6761873.1 DUF4145 domain-containing protein [Tamlana sp. 2_MG-2023]MDO6792209.1 DUF4145 domain-containing protein [Tamlana sp. 1_MG-2023]
MTYIQPEDFLGSFTCPHCGTIAKQDWLSRDRHFDTYGEQQNREIIIGNCQHCNEITIWRYTQMLYPDTGNCPFPNSEMPNDVKKLYLEAASISNKSPRGAAAILRLGIQVLCKELGEKGNNINADIGNLVKKGLPEIVQQSLDVVRVTGNDAVHPGQIETDNPEVVGQLFDLTNVIVEYMIALPKRVSGIYKSLPSNKIDGINKRDGK